MQKAETTITYLDKIRTRGPLKSGYTVIISDDDEVHNGYGKTADEEKEGRSRYYEARIQKLFCVYFLKKLKLRNSSVMNPIIQMGAKFGRATDDIVWHFEFSGICFESL